LEDVMVGRCWQQQLGAEPVNNKTVVGISAHLIHDVRLTIVVATELITNLSEKNRWFVACSIA
jgi:hypothetical protein